MANGLVKIVRPYVTTLMGNKVGGGGSHSVGQVFDNIALRIVEIQFLIDVNANLTIGSTYNIVNGAVGLKPVTNIYFPLNRTDGGNAACTGRITTNGAMTLHPLMSVPTGIQLAGFVVYHY